MLLYFCSTFFQRCLANLFRVSILRKACNPIPQIAVTLGRKMLLIFADECQLLFETSLLSNVNLFHQTRNRQWRLGLQRFQWPPNRQESPRRTNIFTVQAIHQSSSLKFKFKYIVTYGWRMAIYGNYFPSVTPPLLPFYPNDQIFIIGDTICIRLPKHCPNEIWSSILYSNTSTFFF